jgi:hypothetical protein
MINNFSYDEEPKDWITVNGNHIPVMKGQSKKAAAKNFIEERNKNFENKKQEKKTGSKNSGYSKSDKYPNHIQFKEDKESGGYPRKIHSDLNSAKQSYEYKKAA